MLAVKLRYPCYPLLKNPDLSCDSAFQFSCVTFLLDTSHQKLMSYKLFTDWWKKKLWPRFKIYLSQTDCDFTMTITSFTWTSFIYLMLLKKLSVLYLKHRWNMLRWSTWHLRLDLRGCSSVCWTYFLMLLIFCGIFVSDSSWTVIKIMVAGGWEWKRQFIQ